MRRGRSIILFEARNLTDLDQLADAFVKIRKLFEEQNLPQLSFPEKISEQSSSGGPLVFLRDLIRMDARDVFQILRVLQDLDGFTPCDVEVREFKSEVEGVREGRLEIIKTKGPPIILYSEDWLKE